MEYNFMKIIKKIAMLAILGGLATTSYASSEIKVICDRDGESVYLNNQFKTTCDSGEPVPMIAKAGRYTVVVKKDNGDGSYYNYKKSFRIGDGLRKVIEVNSEIHYTEKYYYQKAKNSGDIKAYWTYLDKYSNGKYTEIVKNHIDKYYWNRCDSISACKTYLSKVSWGKYRDRAKREIEDIHYNNCNSISGCKEYLSLYRNGRYTQSAKQKLEKYYFKSCSLDNLKGCKTYLSLYTNGKYINQIKNIEAKYFKNRCNSINNCQNYISNFKNGSFTKQAKEKLERFYYKKSQQSEKYADLYIEKYPNGEYLADVEKYKLFFVAIRTKNVYLYQYFLDKYKNQKDKYYKEINFLFENTYKIKDIMKIKIWRSKNDPENYEVQ